MLNINVFQFCVVVSLIHNKMESDSALHADAPDGAEVLPLEENEAVDTAETGENNVSSQDDVEEAAAAEPAEPSGNY